MFSGARLLPFRRGQADLRVSTKLLQFFQKRHRYWDGFDGASSPKSLPPEKLLCGALTKELEK